jgi:mRNA-degrading endonuclease RelE of RelBE toxin-antitoxin system
LVEFTAEAIAGLAALPAIIQEQIFGKVRLLSDNFANFSPQAFSANLTGLFKLRVDDYRVIVISTHIPHPQLSQIKKAIKVVHTN